MKVGQQQALTALLSKGPDATLEVWYVPNGAAELKRLILDKRSLSELGDDRLAIDGRIKCLQLKGVRPESLPATTINAQAQDIVSTPSAKDRGTVDLTIYPDSDGKVKLDWQRLLKQGDVSKLPDDGNIIQSRSYREIGGTGAFKIKTNIPQDELKPLLESGKYAAIADSLMPAERMFGLLPGELGQSVQLEDNREANAQPGAKSITLYKGLLAKSVDRISEAAFHEWMHVADTHFNELSGQSAFQKKFDAVRAEYDNLKSNGREKESFLYQICEKRFYPQGEHGGHAFDCASEFLASLLTVTARGSEQDWLGLVESKPAAFRAEYASALEALARAASASGIQQDAPLFALINRRKSLLKRA